MPPPVLSLPLLSPLSILLPRGSNDPHLPFVDVVSDAAAPEIKIPTPDEIKAVLKAAALVLSKAKRLDRLRRKKKRRRALAAKLAYEYLKTHPCVDCSETDVVVLDFDHVRGEKRNDISKMIRDGLSVESVRQEISKCEVRCANDHRRKTAKDFGFYRHLKGAA